MSSLLDRGRKETSTTETACVRCGNCCRTKGYVRLRPGEVARMAGYLGMDVYEFTGRFTRLTKGRGELSLSERADGVCIFLRPDGRCGIYGVRPGQCRDFPQRWQFADMQSVCEACRAACAASGAGEENAQ